MKTSVVKYGIIAGAIASAWMTIALILGCENMSSSWGMILGYTAMIAGFSFIFVAIKNHRENVGGGSITFVQAFKIGLVITLIASTLYVVMWLIEYHLFVPDFMEKYSASHLSTMKADGASQIEIDQAASEMAEFKEMYKNPLMIVLITYAEILPIGLIVSLIAAAALKRNNAQKLA